MSSRSFLLFFTEIQKIPLTVDTHFVMIYLTKFDLMRLTDAIYSYLPFAA